MKIYDLLSELCELQKLTPDADVVLDVDKDSSRHLNIIEAIRGDNVIIIVGDV